MDYTRTMTETPGQHLAEINHALALAQVNLKRAFASLAKYEEAMGLARTAKKHSIRCIQVWQEWLAANSPNTRQYITEATDTKLTERATPHTVVWDESIDPTDDDAYPDNTLFRVRSLHSGGRPGAPPMIYFLWSQRWDVHPLFGVGPTIPDQVYEEAKADGLSDREAQEEAWPEQVAALLSEPVEPAPIGYTSLAEWSAGWEPVFDALVAAEAKPSPEVRQEMIDTVPDGEDANVTLATSYQAAVLRAREPKTVLGVIHPPVSSHPIDPEHGEEVPLDWDSLDT